MTPTPLCGAPGLPLLRRGGQAKAPVLREQLLAWWERGHRRAIPWKLRPDDSGPDEGESIDPYEFAEKNRPSL